MTSETRKHRSERYAAIDLGSNTCLLLVAEWDGSRLIPRAEEMRVVRLGAGIDRTGLISEAALDRAEGALREYKDIIESNNCGRVRCVATSAFRNASNSETLFLRLQQATGYAVEKISGQEEGELVLRAVQHEFTFPAGKRITVDVGGGSTEIILVENGQLLALDSLPLGAVRITERWLPGDPPVSTELKAAKEEIERLLSQSDLPSSVEAMVAVGGTPTTFVAMDQRMETYDPAQVHGAILTMATLQRIIAQCSDLPLQQRVQLAGLHPGRADVIIAGGLILQAILNRFGLKQLTVSDRGLRWGVVLDMLHRDGLTARTGS
jgi:exopolyphosphatase/guanosine-5'-triphosphate,3'-diphosphate pyrophosphatase